MHGLWYHTEIESVASKLGTEVNVRRARGANMHRSTHPAETPKEYFRQAFVIPFIDDVNKDVNSQLGLHERFPHSSVTVVSIDVSNSCCADQKYHGRYSENCG